METCNINKYKIKINTFTAEIDKPLNSQLRSLVTLEVDFYEESLRDLQDGEFDKIYRGKSCGSTLVKQGDKKPILAKSKRSASKRLRSALWYKNPEEDFYQNTVNKIIANLDDVLEFLKDK